MGDSPQGRHRHSVLPLRYSTFVTSADPIIKWIRADNLLSNIIYVNIRKHRNLIK